MRYAIGIDFGTESGSRGDGRRGDRAPSWRPTVHDYANGVIDEHLPAPDEDVRLEPDWALQDPADYLATIAADRATPAGADGRRPGAMSSAWASTSRRARCCRPPPTARPSASCRTARANRTPGSSSGSTTRPSPRPTRSTPSPDRAANHGSTATAAASRPSGSTPRASRSSTRRRASIDAADRLIEAADWVIWQLTGVETRNSCTAGYKAIWSKADGFVDRAFFGALDPRFASVVDDKMSRSIVSLGAPRGRALGRRPRPGRGCVAGTPVAVANVDAHVSVPAVGVTAPGTMVAVMGTSTCHLVLGDRPALVEGMCGVVEDGIIPGLFGYEAGQSAVGDIFAWFVRQAVPPEVHEQARRDGLTVHQVLERDAAASAAGRVRTSRARLVERQPLDPGRRRSQRAPRRAHAGHPPGRDLPGAARGDRVRDPGDHRVARGRRRRGRTRRRLRRPAGAERAVDADQRRHHGPRLRCRGVDTGAGRRLGDVRRGRSRERPRWLRLDRGGGRGHGADRMSARIGPNRAARRRLRPSSTPSTSGCTTTSDVARTT